MKHLIQASFLVISLAVSFSLTAQNEQWTHNSPQATNIIGIFLLENGLVIQGSNKRDSLEFTEINPTEGTVAASNVFPTEFEMVYFEQHSADTLLTLSDNGFLWSLDRGGDTLSAVAQLFSNLAATDNFFKVTRAERTNDTLIAYAYDYDDLHVWESRSVYAGGSATSTEIDLGTNTVSRWHSAEGYRATINRSLGEEVHSLTVTNPAGEALLSLEFPPSIRRAGKVLFRSSARLYVLARELRADGFTTSVVLDVDLVGGTYQRIPIVIPNPQLFVSLVNMRLIDGHLILVGGFGRGNVSEALAIALDEQNEEVWRFLPFLQPDYTFISDVIATAGRPGDVLLCGDTGYTDVGAVGNAFTMSVELMVSSLTESPAHLLKIFPNPTNNQLTIESPPTGVRAVEVVDITGRVVNRALSGRVIDVRMLPAGTYFLRAETAGERFLGKFVKQ